MGDEIRACRFSAEDFSRFRSRLADELALFEQMAQAVAFDDSSFVAGLELEAWLVDRNTFAFPENELTCLMSSGLHPHARSCTMRLEWQCR